MSQLPVTNLIPSVLTNARVYREGAGLLGVPTVEMPDFEYLSESISGLGIMGEMDVPVTGHFKAMSLLTPQAHQLDIRGSIQELDAGSGTFVDKPIKVLVKAMPKKSGIGKFEPGKKMEPETELEIYYIKVWLGGVELVEVDKLNFICRLGGSDMLAKIRSNLGMA